MYRRTISLSNVSFPAGNGGVGREDAVPRHGLQGVLQAVASPHLCAGALQAEEGHVSFVHVPDRRPDPEAPERPDAADPEDDLLAEAHLAAAHVEDPGDGTVGGVVQGDVGVEHQDRHASDLRLPDGGLDDAAGQVDGHGEDAAAGRLDGENGQAGEVVVGVDVLLEAVGVHRLPEVSRLVQETDAHEGHAEVAGRLAVVTREDAKAARVDAQGLVDPELHREVGHRSAEGVRLFGEPARLGAVAVQGLDHRLVGAAELRVREEARPLLRLDVDEELDGVVVPPPVVGVDPGEQTRGLGRPAPPEVVGQVTQPLHLLG